MLRPLLLAASLGAVSVPAWAAPVVVTSPQALPADHAHPRVFLGGSIDMGHATDWQADLIAALKDQDVTVLNPRRADWNPAWKPEASDPNFRQQVGWELAALDSADVIVMYLAPGTQSPVSLMELGLHARDGKLIVLCPQGYWRKGNVDITAARYGVQQVATMDELIAATKARIAEWKKGRK
ncbi:nucleoside 2-deoxyribosyltransferase domain-containing protein [Novosphingobium sp. 9]|uniref:nucleoside 2-deoxyribosyltransferase domain-containing protein n=1 Tax=Novosphingobium sp. 9 TaxID=2025349 RepID=UPI0021B6D57E|nr:nucleoside 2-deoxyribosyltransferase domain-containing protein [Novosphingobium sp. 9]